MGSQPTQEVPLAKGYQAQRIDLLQCGIVEIDVADSLPGTIRPAIDFDPVDTSLWVLKNRKPEF